jgi:hypothetical protein
MVNVNRGRAPRVRHVRLHTLQAEHRTELNREERKERDGVWLTMTDAGSNNMSTMEGRKKQKKEKNAPIRAEQRNPFPLCECGVQSTPLKRVRFQ